MDAGSLSFPQAVWLWPYSPQRVCFGWGAPTFQTRALPRRAFSGPAPPGGAGPLFLRRCKKGPARHCFSGITDCTAEISSNRRPECPGSGGIFGCQAANWSRAGLPTENISYFRVLSRVLGKFPEEAVRKPDFFCFSPDSSRFLPSAPCHRSFTNSLKAAGSLPRSGKQKDRPPRRRGGGSKEVMLCHC